MKRCDIEGCGKPARSQSAALCKMHYHRVYRNGTLDTIISHKETLNHSGGYIARYAKDHPLCLRKTSNSRRSLFYEYEHRIVYYDNHGDGPFSCNWCGIEVNWDTLHIDHVDDNRKRNVPENLVASCAICNQGRGREKANKAIREKGRQIEFEGRSMCLSEWAREIGISHAALATRLKKGWPIQKAMTERRGKFGPASKATVSY